MNNINPEHYKKGKIETIDVLKEKLSVEEFKGFCKGVILQYIIRSNHKNGLEDIKKAKWYLDCLVSYLEE